MWLVSALLFLSISGADVTLNAAEEKEKEVIEKTEVAENAEKADVEEKKPKILVVYYSRSGTTEKIGGLLAVALEADQEKVVDKKDRSGVWGYIVAGKDAGFENLTEIGKLKYDPADYDLVVIGTPIWAWKMTPAVRTYIKNNKKKLKNVVFFTTSGGTSYEKVIPDMEEYLGKKALLKNGFFEKEVKKDSKKMVEKLNKFLKEIKELTLTGI